MFKPGIDQLMNPKPGIDQFGFLASETFTMVAYVPGGGGGFLNDGTLAIFGVNLTFVHVAGHSPIELD